MGARVDPRTGMVIPAHSKPPKLPLSFRPSSKVPAKPKPDMDLNEWAIIMGNSIIEQLKPLLMQRPETIKEVIVNAASGKQSSIVIDESIIDVGIGKTDPLQKGEGSATLFKEKKEEDSIEASKNKLKALKRG